MNLTSYVGEILEDVRNGGEEAVREYSEKFDGYGGDLVPDEEEWKAAGEIPEEDKETIKRAIDRVWKNHLPQKPEEELRVQDGSLYGLTYRPIRRVGLYVPGGTPLPSSLIMTAVLARIAENPEVVVVSPPTDGRLDPHTLYVADYLKIDEVYKVGGAQAIGALAYGAGFERVDKIFGPGNTYVNEAKRQVFGHVGIDSLAGPSDVCVIADGTADEETVRIDLESQLEHGEGSKAWLLTTSADLYDFCRDLDVEPTLCEDLESCLAMSNEIAPEHLQIMTENPLESLEKVENAGAVYLGEYTPTPAADYFLGVNHVLPTGGAAKFGSVLTVRDFLKPMSVAYTGEREFVENADIGIKLAEIEGLEKHRKSMEVRTDGEKD